MCVNPANMIMMFLGLKINNFLCFNIDGQKAKEGGHVELLGVQIDNKLYLDMHVKELCQKINKKYMHFRE